MRTLVWMVLGVMGLLMLFGLLLLFRGEIWGLILELLALAVGWGGLTWARQLQNRE